MTYHVLRESGAPHFGSKSYYSAVYVGQTDDVSPQALGEKFGAGSYLILAEVRWGWSRIRVAPDTWKEVGGVGNHAGQ